MTPPEYPATAIPGRPKPPFQPRTGTERGIAGAGAAAGGGGGGRGLGERGRIGAADASAAMRSSVFEFRGFDFFANRDINELKNASRAYFAPAPSVEKHQRLPSTWLGDATPPGTPRHSGDGSPFGATRPPPSLPVMPPRGDKKILGMRKTPFWWLLALLGLLLVIAIGVGVGVGVSREASGGSDRDAIAEAVTASSSSLSPTPAISGPVTSAAGDVSITSTLSPSTTSSSSGSTSTPTGSAEGKIDCPTANGTVYQVPGSDKRFLRICGIDYSADEAQDLRQVPTETILDCMKNCAGTYQCTGCAWGVLEGDTGTQHTCFLKGNLRTPHEADINWAFAVLL
ncbi:hypothetical protein GGS23DRAFT_393036 [Durotheca rogersii]|uniref:uncharacterized protein n=1 Tax=Durotheca rogersii TaxID=419775 RepID=UPI00221F8E5C|nr:uncharacterized protein GGS23DRAFT_393036 [Durotheca rogersii]KAI5856773.1 hypothetical protein GGS23DRAFT_393036 [Durotheca rogersii]